MSYIDSLVTKERIMSSSRARKLALGVAAAVATISSSAQAANIKVAVAANFTTTLGAIISQFQNQYPADTVSYTADSTTVLRNQISGGNAPGYDLFLAADQAAPNLLLTSFPSTVIAPAFLYARGALELWSKTFNVTAGLPSNTQLQSSPVAIANPSAAPYGVAAQQVLATYGIPVPDPKVVLYNNIALTYQAVNQGQRLYGFIAKSSICTKPGSTEIFTPNTFHHSYVFNDPVHGYSEILQNGIKVNRAGRTAAQTTVLNNFVTFLQTSSQAIAKKLYYCYRLP